MPWMRKRRPWSLISWMASSAVRMAPVPPTPWSSSTLKLTIEHFGAMPETAASGARLAADLAVLVALHPHGD